MSGLQLCRQLHQQRILAVGGRELHAKRQPGSVLKPFVYLAAMEAEAADPALGLTPATLVNDDFIRNLLAVSQRP